jgi:hypothetical protein
VIDPDFSAHSLFAGGSLLLLSLLKRQAFGSVTALPFLMDFETHARLLLALPLLAAAEMMAERRFGQPLPEFLERNIIPGDTRSTFEKALCAASKLSEFVIAEFMLVAFVYGLGILVVWWRFVALDNTTWCATPNADGSQLSLAGIYYTFVSLPIFQFILCGWYFRLFIGARFLWQVSRIHLSLTPTHPDRTGGFSFVSETTRALTVFAAAHGALLSGYIATRIFSGGKVLTDFTLETAVMIALVLTVTLLPTLAFTPQLVRARQEGRREYGIFVARYVREFDPKWVRGAAPTGEPLIGSPDIQSLAGMANSYEVVRTFRVTLITREVVLRLAVATLIPLAPCCSP